MDRAGYGPAAGVGDLLSQAVPQLPEYADSVLEVVDQIPPGKVLAYGDVSEIVGRGGPRGVGSVMAHFGSMTHWWRVVRADGHPPRGHEDRARVHYREEATPLVRGQLAGNRVDMARARWEGPPPLSLSDSSKPPQAGRS